MNLPLDYLLRIYRALPVNDSVRLSPYQWQFWAEIDGKRTVLEIGHHLQLTELTCQCALESLLEAKLVDELLLNYHEYSHAVHIGNPESKIELEEIPIKPSQEPIDKVVPVTPQTYLLCNVIRFIISHSGSGLEGKLSVYRVFLQIPPPVLLAEGLTSFLLDDITTQVQNPEVRKLISDAILKILGVPYTWQ